MCTRNSPVFFFFAETETVLVETCTHVGLYCGITQGIFYDKFGNKAEGVLASFLVGMGYAGVFLATGGPTDPTPAAVVQW